MFHEYMALNQNISDKNEFVQKKIHHDELNNNQLDETMYNDAVKFLFFCFEIEFI